MIFIKYLTLILIFIISISIGFLISKKYKNRVKTLQDMRNALNIFETKIKFTYASIPETFEEISNQIDGEVGNIFKNSTILMDKVSAGEAWDISINNVESSMNEEDKNILKNLSKLLGKTDIEGQISEIRLVSNFLDKQIKIAEKEKIKNEKMYKTLGGIIGLALVIILA